MKKFKIEKGFTYKKLLIYLNERGIKISFNGLVFWCSDYTKRKHSKIDTKHIHALMEITGYKFEDFYNDQVNL